MNKIHNPHSPSTFDYFVQKNKGCEEHGIQINPMFEECDPKRDKQPELPVFKENEEFGMKLPEINQALKISEKEFLKGKRRDSVNINASIRTGNLMD